MEYYFKSMSLWGFFLRVLLVPDRQYEVRVWAFDKQKDGAAAVWKGRTDKIHGRRKTSFRGMHL